MRIGVFSKADSFGGGASRVAEDVVRVFSLNGHFVKHYVSWSKKGFTEQRLPVNGRCNFPFRIVNFGLKKTGFPEVIPFELPFILRTIRREKLEVLHFHDISSAFSPLTLYALSKRIPVLWTLHDCSPFTAGCLYPMECSRYRIKCGRCPQIGHWPIDCYIDTTKFLHSIKAYVHRHGCIVPLAPSVWMSDLAFNSGMVHMRPRIIPNSVDTNVFRVLDKHEARISLGLDPTRIYFLLSAGSILDERKGTAYALDAVRKIANHRPMLIVAGTLPEASADLVRGIEYRSFGYVTDRERLNAIYASADVFLFSSLADNQPLAILESMASGTPIIGFATGGIPDMIQNDRTGFLVPQRDIDALAAAIDRAITSKAYMMWGICARQDVESRFSENAFYQNHVELYREVIRTYDSK